MGHPSPNVEHGKIRRSRDNHAEQRGHRHRHSWSSQSLSGLAGTWKYNAIIGRGSSMGLLSLCFLSIKYEVIVRCLTGRPLQRYQTLINF